LGQTEEYKISIHCFSVKYATQALVLQEQAEEELLKQDSIVIRKETSQKV
jgi:hypothetical protein